MARGMDSSSGRGHRKLHVVNRGSPSRGVINRGSPRGSPSRGLVYRGGPGRGGLGFIRGRGRRRGKVNPLLEGKVMVVRNPGMSREQVLSTEEGSKMTPEQPVGDDPQAKVPRSPKSQRVGEVSEWIQKSESPKKEKSEEIQGLIRGPAGFKRRFTKKRLVPTYRVDSTIKASMIRDGSLSVEEISSLPFHVPRVSRSKMPIPDVSECDDDPVVDVTTQRDLRTRAFNIHLTSTIACLLGELRIETKQRKALLSDIIVNSRKGVLPSPASSPLHKNPVKWSPLLKVFASGRTRLTSTRVLRERLELAKAKKARKARLLRLHESILAAAKVEFETGTDRRKKQGRIVSPAMFTSWAVNFQPGPAKFYGSLHKEARIELQRVALRRQRVGASVGSCTRHLTANHCLPILVLRKINKQKSQSAATILGLPSQFYTPGWGQNLGRVKLGKAAYKAWIRSVHPDRNPHPEAKFATQLLTNAWLKLQEDY